MHNVKSKRWCDGRDPRVIAFAVALRQARLARALSINDVAKATLLSDKQILGLENDDYSYFYNGLFASRSADAYAAFLGVDFNLDGAPLEKPWSILS